MKAGVSIQNLYFPNNKSSIFQIIGPLLSKTMKAGVSIQKIGIDIIPYIPDSRNPPEHDSGRVGLLRLI